MLVLALRNSFGVYPRYGNYRREILPLTSHLLPLPSTLRAQKLLRSTSKTNSGRELKNVAQKAQRKLHCP